MPEGLQIGISKGQYPELEGLGDNPSFTFSGQGTVEWTGDQGMITFNSFDVQTENKADKDLRGLRGESQGPYENNEEVEI